MRSGMKNRITAVGLGGLMGALVVVFLTGPVTIVALAQTPTPAAAPVAPAVDELVTAWLAADRLAQQLASRECAQLDSAKQFQAQRQDIVRRVEARHPGFTLDFAAAKLIPRPKVAP